MFIDLYIVKERNAHGKEINISDIRFNRGNHSYS